MYTSTQSPKKCIHTQSINLPIFKLLSLIFLNVLGMLSGSGVRMKYTHVHARTASIGRGNASSSSKPNFPPVYRMHDLSPQKPPENLVMIFQPLHTLILWESFSNIRLATSHTEKNLHKIS